MSILKKKQKQSDRISKVVAAVRAKFGADSAVTLSAGGIHSLVTEVIPTGLGPLDYYALGRGGMPVGRLVELFSEEAGGKSALGLQIAANCQRENGIVIWVDAEHSLDLERAALFGVNADELIVIQSMYGEGMAKQAITAVQTLGKPSAPCLLVVDSVEALTPKACMTEPLNEKERMGIHAQLVSKFIRAINHLAPRHRLCAVFINQVREDFKVKFGDPTKTPGGKALKFYASVRLQGWSGKKIRVGKEVVGKRVTWKVVKNRLGPPDRTIRARFMYEKGWDDDWTTLNYAKDLGLAPMPAKSSNPEEVAAARAALDACNWRGVMKTKTADDDEDEEGGEWSSTEDARPKSKAEREEESLPISADEDGEDAVADLLGSEPAPEEIPPPAKEKPTSKPSKPKLKKKLKKKR